MILWELKPMRKIKGFGRRLEGMKMAQKHRREYKKLQAEKPVYKPLQ